MKNIKTYALIATLFILFSTNSYAQKYEQQTPAVKEQMNLNKKKGKDIWSNIATTYKVFTIDLENKKELQLRAKSISKIVSIDIKEDNVVIICKGATPFDEIKRIFSNIVTGINKVEGTTYVLKSSK